MSKVDISNHEGIIYRFEVDGGLFYYVGQTKLTMEARFKQHRISCLGLDEKHIDNSKKYVVMRKLGINAENWAERVICEVVKVCRLDEIDYYENLNIDLLPQSLNTQHSLKYLDGYYTKPYYRRGAYTPEELKQRNLESANKRYDEKKEILKKRYIKYNQDNINKYKCECCGFKNSSKTLYMNHCKTKKHLRNESYAFFENVD